MGWLWAGFGLEPVGTVCSKSVLGDKPGWAPACSAGGRAGTPRPEALPAWVAKPRQVRQLCAHQRPVAQPHPASTLQPAGFPQQEMDLSPSFLRGPLQRWFNLLQGHRVQTVAFTALHSPNEKLVASATPGSTRRQRFAPGARPKKTCNQVPEALPSHSGTGWLDPDCVMMTMKCPTTPVFRENNWGCSAKGPSTRKDS